MQRESPRSPDTWGRLNSCVHKNILAGSFLPRRGESTSLEKDAGTPALCKEPHQAHGHPEAPEYISAVQPLTQRPRADGGWGSRLQGMCPRGRTGLAVTDLHSVAAHGEEGEKEHPLDAAQLWGSRAARGGEVRKGQKAQAGARSACGQVTGSKAKDQRRL